ncbi:MAG: hypothetical protein GXP31_15520 [Kiritimatiellaeota bacterium]|nr:hypothetical protein [Kiritimatiellota bacterium]
MRTPGSSAPDRAPQGTVTVAPAPAGEKLSEDYRVEVNGIPVPVYACRVSAVPFNQVWPGYQRPLDQTETAGLAYWDMTGPVRVEVRSMRKIESVTVRPYSLGIRPKTRDDRITFELKRPRPVIVQVNGPHHALHLFPSPPETDVPTPDTPGLRYFGPGVHKPGRIVLKDNEGVYIAAGAVVYGSIHAAKANNIQVRGRGILDVGPYPRGKGGGAIRFTDCRNIAINGIIMRDPDVWCCSLFGCRDATISNVKLIGLWRYNADGIDICNSQNVTVRDCFVRSYDDAIVLKGLKWKGGYDGRPVRDILVTGCTLWCDWGRNLEIGAETCAPEFADIRFQDCDIVRATHIAMDIQHGDRATIRNVVFQDIRVEMDDAAPRPKMQRKRGEHYRADPHEAYLPQLAVIVIRGNSYSKDPERGNVRNVVFRNIAVTAPRMPPSSLQGWDAEHTVDGVRFENIRLNGRLLPTAKAAGVRLGQYVHNVSFGKTAAE